jgi:hypothetical protein
MDLHRDLGGAFVPLGVVFVDIRAAGKAGRLLGAIGCRTADIADPVRGLNISDRPLDILVPYLLGLLSSEPPHRHAPNS